MKTAWIALGLQLAVLPVFAQDEQDADQLAEQQLESIVALGEEEAGDDGWQQRLEVYRRHPVNINTAGADELRGLQLLTELQVQYLVAYRQLFGSLTDLYELQAIPGWDVYTIRRLLPYITVADTGGLVSRMGQRWKGGEHSLLYRQSRVLEKARGYRPSLQTGVSPYAGSPDKIFFRYRYNYKNLLQWGLAGTKDAGERFFRGQAKGFDAYTAHFFARQLGAAKAIVLGDYSVSLGQGLVQWQSLAFKKGADVLAIKRQGQVLNPYNSAGAYHFLRGAGITLQRKNWEATLFFSARQLDATIRVDSLHPAGVVSSIHTSGYHRTASELRDQNSLGQQMAGGNLQHRPGNGHFGINVVHSRFSLPLQKSGLPYNFYAARGGMHSNASVDYSYTWRNIHFFGEAAGNDRHAAAFLNGLLVSFGAKADAAMVYRNISSSYHSQQGNAFTENSLPTNEAGLYAGITIRPSKAVNIAAYVDVFRFPWLKYRVDAPSAGRDYLVQVNWRPDKYTELYMRYKDDAKQGNRPGTNTYMHLPDMERRQSIRLQAGMPVSKRWTARSRMEVLWYNKHAAGAGQGFLLDAGCFYRPVSGRWSGNFRLTWFETDGYSSRLYAYENDVLYSHSMPALYRRGFRYFANFRLAVVKKTIPSGFQCDFWLKWSQTLYPGQTTVGSGLDLLPAGRKSEVKFQLMLKR